MNLSDQVAALEKDWAENPRWKHVKRPYTAEEVVKLRGSLQPECTLARKGAEKLWNYLFTEDYINCLGALTGGQAVQQVKAGVKAIYLSGWQVAADNNSAGTMYPDQSLYPVDSVPKVITRINNAFRRADQIEWMNTNGTPKVDFFAPIIADAEAGFGGNLNAFELMKRMISAGAAGVHFEDQLASVKKCGHLGGKVLVPTQEAVQKLNKVITKRFLKTLEEKAKKEPEVYNDFWSSFGLFLKEGVTTDFTHRDQLLGLLRYESSYTEEGVNTSLADYLSRAPEGQKEIYYLFGPSRAAIESGPYIEAFKARKIEVLYLYEPIDEFVMNHARAFEEKNFVSADNDEIDLDAIALETETDKEEALEASESEALCAFIKEKLGDEVTEVSASERLVGSPAMIVNADKQMTAQMRKMIKAMQQKASGAEMPGMGGEPPVKLQVNPRHPLVKNLAALYSNNGDLAGLISQQLLDNARIAAGLLEDPSQMVQRNYQILEQLSSVKKKAVKKAVKKAAKKALKKK